LTYDLKDFSGKSKFVGTLSTENLGFSGPSIKGSFELPKTEKTNKDKDSSSYKLGFNLEFRDLSPYRSYFQDELSNGNVLYLNNRFMTNWVFGIQFGAERPRFLNGEPFLYKVKKDEGNKDCEVTKSCIH
jgi:hypothetical protein